MNFHTLLFIIVSGFIFSGCQQTRTLIASQSPTAAVEQTPSTQPFSTPTSSPEPFTEFTAQFEIYTHSTKRIFTDTKYHRQSSEVFIDKPDPSKVQVKTSGVTWNQFFQTLPFSLNKDCLVTGTKQTFCSNDQNKLRFYINDVETPNALDLEIQPNDFLQVIYGS